MSQMLVGDSAHTGQGWSASTTPQPSLTTTQAILTSTHDRIVQYICHVIIDS